MSSLKDVYFLFQVTIEITFNNRESTFENGCQRFLGSLIRAGAAALRRRPELRDLLSGRGKRVCRGEERGRGRGRGRERETRKKREKRERESEWVRERVCVCS
jgi:hypothetical protein